MRRILYLIALTLAQPISGWATNILDIYQEAKTKDPAFGVAEAEFRAGLERLPQARAGLLPNLSSSASTGKTVTKTEGVQKVRYDTSGYSLSLTQPLLRLQNWATYSQGKQQIIQVQAQYSSAQQDLILRVAQAYFDVLLAQDNVTVSQAQKTAINEQLAQAKRNFEVGTATITDTNEAQAKYDQATAKEIADQNDLEIKRQALRQLIATVPDKLASLKENMILPLPVPNDINEWVSAAEKNSQILTTLRAGVEIAKTEVWKQWSGHLPTIDYVGSYSENRNGSIDLFGRRADIRSNQAGLQANLSIFAGGQTQSRVREAVANRERANFELEANRRAVEQTTRAAFLGVTSGVTQVSALQQALKSSQVSLDSTKLGREVGVRTSLDVLNADQQVFQSRRDLLQARYNVIVNQLKLKAASGQLEEKDLVEVNNLLEKQ